MSFIKKTYYWFLEYFEIILDSFSSRLCFFCKQNLGALVCEDCVEKELSLKRKHIDYKALDHFFLSFDQVFYPKVFYLFNFLVFSSHLIKKAKYTRPYFSKFFAKLLAEIFQNKINLILNDDLTESFMQDFPLAKSRLNIYISYTPMYLLKKKERTFNFAELLAENLHLLLKDSLPNKEVLYQGSKGVKRYSISELIFVKDLFTRVKNTKPLFNLGQESRIREVKNSFEMNVQNIKAEDLNILLIIDDICTTGSTIMELMKLSRLKANFDDQIGLSIYGRNLKQI